MAKNEDVKEILAAYLKELHLPAFRASYEELARQAEQEGLSFEQYLLTLATRECQERRNKRVERLLHDSRGPAHDAVGPGREEEEGRARLRPRRDRDHGTGRPRPGRADLLHGRRDRRAIPARLDPDAR